MKPTPRSLDLHSILTGLRTRQFGRALQILDTCTSTNDKALELASFGAPHGYAVLAEEQTAGRGRLTRSWASPRGGIWMTIVLRPPFGFGSLNGLPLIGALAVTKSINSSLTTKANVRWPNDVVVGQRKIAGTLAEAKFEGSKLLYALLGIGIDANFHSRTLKGVSPKVTTLLDQLGSPIDREALICLLLLEIESMYDMAASNHQDELMALLREMDCSRGRLVTIEIGDEKIQGVIEGYDSFTRVRIGTTNGSLLHLETSTAESVEYSDLLIYD